MLHDHILIVDDDKEIRNLLSDYLLKNGFRATSVPDGNGMWTALEESKISLVILDLMLPGEDGLTLCRKVRARSEIPVIMLTARGEDTDRIVGLEMGADDYMAKPFNPRELLARIKGVLRRAKTSTESVRESESRYIQFAKWKLDTVTRQLLSPEGVAVQLSGSEYRLLKVFITHAGQVLSRDQLMDLSRGKEIFPFDRSIDVQVSRLRQRLGDDAKEPKMIKTLRGEGYVLAVSVEYQ